MKLKELISKYISAFNNQDLDNLRVLFESSSVAVISRSAALIAVATSDKSLPVISSEKSADFDPDVTVKAYVPGS